MANVLIYVEHSGTTVRKAALAGVRFGQQMAEKSGGKLHLLLLGKGAQQAAAELTSFGAEKIYAVEDAACESYMVEPYTQAMVAAQKACSATYIGGSATSTSKDCFPRVAARLQAGMASDVLAIVDDKRFKRPMWAGNITATVEITTPIKVCTVRATEFSAPVAASAASSVEALAVSFDASRDKAKLVSHKEVKSERPDVTVAARVVSGGRGVKGVEGFKLVEQLADKLGAGVGASRAVCDAGWVPNDLQIGQTGKVVAPNLYIALGISGAIQHLAGMKSSKVIVAINKDKEAPIFQVADYGLVADLFTAVPELLAAL